MTNIMFQKGDLVRFNDKTDEYGIIFNGDLGIVLEVITFKHIDSYNVKVYWCKQKKCYTDIEESVELVQTIKKEI